MCYFVVLIGDCKKNYKIDKKLLKWKYIIIKKNLGGLRNYKYTVNLYRVNYYRLTLNILMKNFKIFYDKR